MQRFYIFITLILLITRVRFIFAVAQLYSEGDECLLPNDEGICKSAFDCRWIRDEQIHENDWTHCNYGHSSNLICCADPDFTLHDTLDCHTDTEDIFSPETLNECMKRDTKTSKTTEFNLKFDKIFYSDDHCKTLHDEFVRLKEIEDYIEGVAKGENATETEFPFMAALLTQQPDNTFKTVCGGVILTKRHILTAAHCINYNATDYLKFTRVRVGSIYVDKVYQELKVSKFTAHPAYRSSGSGNDIAILELDEDVKVSKDAFPACLYHGREALKLESNATILGFGQTEKTDTPPILQKAKINIKDGLFCSKAVISKFNYDGLKEEQICAGDTDIRSDACRGDSGGPLIQTIANEWQTIIGLTSFGPGFCNSNKRPGVYTRVSSFIPWIQRVVEGGPQKRMGRNQKQRGIYFRWF